MHNAQRATSPALRSVANPTDHALGLPVLECVIQHHIAPITWLQPLRMASKSTRSLFEKITIAKLCTSASSKPSASEKNQFLSLIPLMTSLKQLYLNQSGLNVHELKKLSIAIKCCNNINQIYLNNNPFGITEESIPVLANMISTKKTLTRLDLRDTKIITSEASELYAHLKHAFQGKEMYIALQNNPCNLTGIEELIIKRDEPL